VKAKSERRLQLMFQALEVSLDLVGSLRRPVERLRSRDRALSEQIRRAASGISLNLAEGRRRTGADRLHHWRIAAGSAEEVRTALRVAMAWGDVTAAEVSAALVLLDRLLAMLWRLTR
jgi:four helix bundle protein